MGELSSCAEQEEAEEPALPLHLPRQPELGTVKSKRGASLPGQGWHTGKQARDGGASLALGSVTACGGGRAESPLPGAHREKGKLFGPDQPKDPEWGEASGQGLPP